MCAPSFKSDQLQRWNDRPVHQNDHLFLHPPQSLPVVHHTRSQREAPLLLFSFSTTDSNISGLLSGLLSSALPSSFLPRSTVQKSTRRSKASRVHFHFQLPGGGDDTLQEILLLSSRMTRINVRLGVSHRGSLLRGEVLFLRLASRVIAGFYIMNKYLRGLQLRFFFFFFPSPCDQVWFPLGICSA